MAGHSNSKFRSQRGAAGFRPLVLTTCLALLCAGTLAVRADVRFDVFLGYDWIVPQACWFPVVCEIKNDGPPFVGTVEVDGGHFNQEQTRRAVVELPTGTLKRFVVPVFSSRNFGTWDVRLLDERGKLRAEQTGLRAKAQPLSGTPLVGALVRTPAGTPTFPNLSQDSTLQPAVARLLPAIFPDNPMVLEGLSCIYLNSEKALELTVNQVRALLDWLNGGGHLIVGVEQISEVTATPWLRNVLPCALNDFRAVQSHPELQQWLQSTPWPADAGDLSEGQPRVRTIPPPRRSGAASSTARSRPPPQSGGNATEPFRYLRDDPAFERADLQVAVGEVRDGQVVVAAGDKPLIVTANRGRGRVTALLFSPELEPFRSWKNLPAFWAKLAEVPDAGQVSTFRQQSGWSSDGIFKAMIDSRQIHKLPVTWLLLLLIVYLVVIGPLDQRWLKRIGRPMLTWITFPCYVVLFSLLIYFIGYKLRNGESEWNELHVVDVLPKGDQAELRGQTYASVYSPSNQRYRLQSRQEFATLRSEFAGMYNNERQDEKAVFMQEGDGSFDAEIFVPVWTSRLVVSDWWQSAPVPVILKVVPQGGQWQVTVVNRTERALANAHIVIEDYVMGLGEVPARGSGTFAVSKANGTPLRDFVSQHGGLFQMAVQAQQRVFGGGGSEHIDDLPNASMAASFLAQLGSPANSMRQFISPPGLDLSSLVKHGNAVLLAWAGDYSPVKPMRQFSPRRIQKNTLWRVATPVPSPKS